MLLMHFSHLASFFDKLEATSSRLQLIEILSDLFKQVDKREIDKVIYLTQGRIAPFYAPIEIGMADKMVATAVGVAFSTERAEVLEANARLGDLGIAAMQLSSKQKVSDQGVSVEDVFATLSEISINCNLLDVASNFSK